MDYDSQMATSSAFKTLRELYDEPSGDEVLARIKIAAASFLPDGWEDWKVCEGVPVEVEPCLLNKLRFCLPAVDIAKAFDPEATCLQERPYRDMKVKMLSWPFCRGLILGPPSLAMKIRGSALQSELVRQSAKSVCDKLQTRKEASKALGGQVSDSDPEVEPEKATRPRRDSNSRLEALEQESKATRTLLHEILDRMDGRHIRDSSSEQEEEEEEGGSDSESDEPLERPTWSPPRSSNSLMLDFCPRTKEQEPTIPEPDSEIKQQGIDCQRIGLTSWNKIRYLDAQKKLQASPVFGALSLNPQLKHLSTSNSLTDYMEKTEGSYGTITHGLLLQAQAFKRGILNIIEKCPSAIDVVNKELADRSAEFRQISDNLLQFTCGKRAEAIEIRRKALAPVSENISPLLHKIPPSPNFLFDEDKLQELSKAPSSTFDAFKKKQFKRKFTSDHRDKSTPPIKRSKPLKKMKKELKTGQERLFDPKASSSKDHSKKKTQKDRRHRTGRHF
ncbi:hypothetical protein NE865_16107 [Phthorimaea operculella]|nr:hypothetical protein NE865_16107 [Phthorimaea operculella]